jgi:alkylation response protein AidB-like acyl-CoA dehydrogenase
MANHYEDNDDLRFYVENAIDWAPLLRLTDYDGRAEGGFESPEEGIELFTEILGLLGGFAGSEIAPRWRELDNEPPVLKDGEVVMPPVQEEIFDQLKELEVHGMCLPRELGGLACPLLVMQISNELMARADVSVCAHNGFHGGIAMAMLAYSIHEGTTEFDVERGRISRTRFQEAIEEIRSGEAWGSMDITEPDAGSDMGAIRCRGMQADDGTWRVTGPKIYITSGHGKHHFVIARTEAAGPDPLDGLKGLSMFLVKAFEDDPETGKRTRYSTIDALEEKLGHHASATVAISFEDAPAELIGEPGDGFKHMLLLMNNARVGVGFEAIGLCEAAYRMACEYAAQRPSMGKTIDRHEMIADYLDEMRTDIQAMRALAMHAGWHEEMGQKLFIKKQFMPLTDEESKALDADLKKHRWASRRATPLLKYYASERAVDIARCNLQIHGGSGYTTDYGAEKLLRDALVLPIYEGTSQIQCLMAMKDTLLSVVRSPTAFFAEMAQVRWEAVSGRGTRKRQVARLRLIQLRVVRFLITRLAGAKFGEMRSQPMSAWKAAFAKWDPKRDFALAMLHAERLTKILVDVQVAEVLFEQTKKHPERGELLDRWLERAGPRCRYLEDEITHTGLRLLEQLEETPHDDAQMEAAK